MAMLCFDSMRLPQERGAITVRNQAGRRGAEREGFDLRADSP